MPAGAFFFLHAYGPAAGACVTAGAGEAIAGVNATARVTSASATGAGSVPLAKATRLVNAPATVTGIGSMPRALPKARARAASVIKVNELSQDDVTGAVLEAKVEGTVSLKEALRLLLAVAAGNASGLDGASPEFSSLDGSKTRIAGTYSAGTRTVTSRDPT